MAHTIGTGLSLADVEMLVEALDAYEYWQLGDELPRHDGMVWIPGDGVDGDRFWERAAAPHQAELIAEVVGCRDLVARLRDLNLTGDDYLSVHRLGAVTDGPIE